MFSKKKPIITIYKIKSEDIKADKYYNPKLHTRILQQEKLKNLVMKGKVQVIELLNPIEPIMM